MNNRLHKSRTNRVIAGVCGGVGEYFDVDPTFVRLFFVLLAFFHGVGILAYIILWIVMPQPESVDMHPRDAMRENINSMRDEATRFGQQFRGDPANPATPESGASSDVEVVESSETPEAFEPADTGETPRLTRPSTPLEPRVATNRQFLAGAILLILGVLFLLDNLNVFWWLSWGRTWPLILIAIGAYLLYDRSRSRSS